ncbi:hypothetical protein [Escherichia coli]|uniref:hypothetical protein n=3 Tax=Escherichia coli TaxID=562 RepID=UPI0019D29917|nr:hypothetical protein [Escherichia coli]MBN6133738.1 hypothetical protein [Escherichia coli]
MSNYKTLVTTRFNQGDIILNPSLVSRYSQAQRHALARGICGILSIEWLSLLCWSNMSINMATERLSNDIRLQEQSIRNAVYHNKKILAGYDSDFSELFNDIYQRFNYSNLNSNINNPKILFNEINNDLMQDSYAVLVLYKRNGEEHMVAVGRSFGMTGIFDPNVGLIKLHHNIEFDGEILNEMFRFYNVSVVDVDILRRTALTPAPHTVIRY